MGSRTFLVTQQGTDPAQAFSEAHAAAQFKDGHGGYTGTIAEKDGFTVITRAPLWETAALREAQALLDADDDRISDKWGPAGAIPYVAEIKTVIMSGLSGTKEELPTLGTDAYTSSKRYRRGELVVDARLSSYNQPPTSPYGRPLASSTVTDASVTLTIRRADAPKRRTVEFDCTVPDPHDPGELGELVKAATQKKYRLKPEETVTQVRARTPFPTNPHRHKVTAQRTQGRPVTRYVLAQSRSHGTWASGFDSQSAARKFGMEHARELLPSGGIIAIEAVTRREGGAPLAEISVEVLSTTYRVEAEIESAGAAVTATPPDGWVFFGWASC